MKQICPKCKGSGLVFEPASLLLTFAFPLVWLMERNEGKRDNPITKRDCPTCNGKGKIEL